MAKDKSSSLGYPSEFCSHTEKLTDKWALRYIRAAWTEMQNDSHFNIDSRIKRYELNRTISEGLQDLSDVIKTFTQDQDMSHALIDYAVSTPLPKMAKIARRTIYNRPYKPTATPIDSLSVSKSGNKRNELLNDMKMEELRLEMEENGVNGVIPPAKENLPKDKDELEIHLLLNPKMGKAVSYEYLIRQGLMQNGFDKIQEKIAKDLVDNKISATRTYFDSDNNLRVDLVDPVRLISSFVENDDFSDATHIGQIRDVTISELREMMGDKYEEKELQWIADNASKGSRSDWEFGSPKYYKNVLNRDRYDDKKVQLVHLQVKQYDRVTYIKKGKINGGFRIEKKSYDYETPKNAKREREVKHKGAQSIYDGYWVVGTDYVFDWHRKEDSFRDRLNGKWSHTAKFDYVVCAPDIYDMQNKSLIEAASYRNKQLINLTLKAQQILIQASPPTVAYDVDALNSAIDGMGFGGIKPIEMVNIQSQTGRYFFGTRNENGEPISPNQAPIFKVDGGIDSSFREVMEAYNVELSRMRDDLGIPEAVSGDMDKKAGLGIQQLAAEGHKSSMSDLITAYDYLTSETAKRVYIGLQYQIINGVNVPELEASLGEINMKEISLTEMSKADFDIDIEMLPDQYEIEEIRVDLQRMVETNAISPEAKYSVSRVAKESTKKAEALITLMAKKYRKEQEDSKNKSIELQTKGNAEVAQATAQMEAKNIELKYNLENRNKLAEIEAEANKDKQEWEFKFAYLKAETEDKKELIEKAAEMKETEAENQVDRDKKSTGYDISKDSVTKEAGKVEPSVYSSDLNMKQSIGVPTA